MNTSLPKRIVTTEVSQTRFAFILVISLIFLWAFSNTLNLILIPHLKKTSTLAMTQSTSVDSALYIAYVLIALPAVKSIRLNTTDANRVQSNLAMIHANIPGNFGRNSEIEI